MFRTLPATLRRWAVVEAVRRRIESGVCGRLSSLRFQWYTPRRNQVQSPRIMGLLLDAAVYLAESQPNSLQLRSTEDHRIIFALALFNNNVSAEFEVNEGMPSGYCGNYMLNTNFSGGHAGNQPPSGYLSQSGMLLSDDEGMHQLILDNPAWPPSADEIELAGKRAAFYGEPPMDEHYMTMVEEALSWQN